MILENKLISAAMYHFSKFEEIYYESYDELNLDGKRDYSKNLIETGTDRIVMLYHGLLGSIATDMYKLIKPKSTTPKAVA